MHDAHPHQTMPDAAAAPDVRFAQAPFAQIERPFAPASVLSADEVEAIHQAALTVLAEVGIRLQDPQARRVLQWAGAEVADDRLRFPPGMVAAKLRTAPAAFVLDARNPSRRLAVGGADFVLASVGGAGRVAAQDGTRRAGTFAEMCDALRLVQMLNPLHQEGGGPFLPLDLPAGTRHLDICHAQIRLLDKSWQTRVTGRGRAMDVIEMAALMLRTTPEGLKRSPVLVAQVVGQAPLDLGGAGEETLVAMAEHGQVTVICPSPAAGATTLAGALIQHHAEALAGIALAQIISPGVPVVYGGPASQTAKAASAPSDPRQAMVAAGQLARRVGVPFQIAPTVAASAPNADAASAGAVWAGVMAGGHLASPAAGAVDDGTTASLDRLVLDAEQLQALQSAIASTPVGRAGFAPTTARADRSPLDHAASIRRALLAEYEAPPLDPAIDEALSAFVARRKQEGGVQPA